VRGYHFLHTALDAHSRLAYSEPLTDERNDTAAEFRKRASAWLTEHGTVVQKILSDKGSATDRAPSAKPWAISSIAAPGRIGGKVQRSHRTLADEWAYAQAPHQRMSARS